MAIIRERDYWQAKRDVEYYEERITNTLPDVENAIDDSESQYWQMVLEIYAESLSNAKQIVAEHDGVTVRPGDVDRPQNESTLSQWVSA